MCPDEGICLQKVTGGIGQQFMPRLAIGRIWEKQRRSRAEVVSRLVERDSLGGLKQWSSRTFSAHRYSS